MFIIICFVKTLYLFGIRMGAQVSRKDFEWTEEETPHSARRKEILG
jgi:hypothetical protein